MSRGRRNKLVGQVAEHLAVAELGRRGLIATGFAGNVPTFDSVFVITAYDLGPKALKALRRRRKKS